MKTISRLRQALVVCALVIAGVTAFASEASATHFRYGSITWQVPNPMQPNVVTIRFDAVFRWSFGWQDGGGACPVGFVPTGPVGPGSCPPVGAVLTSAPGQITSTVPVRVGPGPMVSSFPVALTVTSINPTEDWFSGTFQATLTFPNANGDHVLEFTNCCRISTLRDGNNDQTYRVRTRVTVRRPPSPVNQPPTVATLPVVTLAQNQAATFPIAAADPNLDPIAFSITPIAESGLVTASPTGFALSPTGTVTWTPTIAGLYAVQIKVSDPAGAYTVADFILNVKPLTGLPPVVHINGTPGAKTMTVVYGTPVTFTVQGVDPENTPVLLSHTGLPLGATTTPALPITAMNPMTTFNWTPGQPAIGTYVLIFAALDGDGRQASNSMSVTVTGNPPTITCSTSPSPLEATGPAGALFNISASVGDPDGDPLTIAFFVDGVQRQVSGLLTPPATQAFAGTFGLGGHTYEGRVADGLTTRSCTGTFSVVDTHAPVLTVVPGDQSLPATSPAGAIANFTATAVDDVDPTPTVVCSRLSGTAFAVGPTMVTCTATDDSGNTAAQSFTITVFDDVAPTLSVPRDIVAEATGPGGAAVPFVTSATDVVDGTVPVLCSALSGDTFPLGVTVVNCSATDSAGNAAGASFSIKVVDTTPPAFAAPPSITAEATSPAGAVVGYAVPTATDAVDVITGVTCLPPPGGTFPLGTTVVTCTSSDLAGNTTSHTFQVTVVDTTPPAIAPHADIVVAADSAAGTTVNYGAPATHDAVGGAGIADCVPPPGTTFPLGTTPVNCTAVDAAGNHATSTFNVIVFNTAPTFTPPPDISTPATGAAGATVLFDLFGSDAEEGAIPASCTPPSGTTFPIGFTVVTCTVTDRVGATASGSFLVIVTNNAPTFTPPANITTEATSPAGAAVTFAATGSDVEDGTIVAVCVPPSGSTFAIGSTPVNCTVTDSAGAGAAGTFTVTVVDTTPPVFDPGSLGPQTLLGSCGSVNIIFVPPTATDTAGPVTVVCTPVSAASAGANTSTCTATDAAGNTTQVTIVINVLQPLQVLFTPPLSDDNVANNVDTDADVPNVFKVGQAVPHKVRILGCGQDVTTTAPITVKLAVAAGATGAGPNLINDASDFNGVGNADGTMVLTDGLYHFNLATNSAEYPAGGQQFRSLVTVAYTSAPTLIVGREDARLQSK